jgi:antitoxin VapB
LIVFGRAWLDFAGFGSIWFWLGFPASPYDCLDDVVHTYESLRRKAANMTLSIRDAATDQLVRELAKRKNLGLTEAVRLAVANELRRLDDETPLGERIAAIRRSIVARGLTGEKADKAFFDDLSGDV